MKQLGNLALVCANRSDVLLQIQRGTVCFSIGIGTQMETISLAWDDDEVTVANTQGFYSVLPNEPDSKTSKCNGGRGSVLWWSKAPFWNFSDGVCSIYSSDTKHTEDYLIMAFRVLGEEVA